MMKKLIFTLLLLMLTTSALASKILKNTTASPVEITDTGITVPASSQYEIIPTEYSHFAASDDTAVLVGDGTLVVNDGQQDLSISYGIDLIKGYFPKQVQIIGDDGNHAADVTLVDGKKKLEANVSVSITTTNLIGKDSNPSTWCRVDTAGAVDDTITITIPDDSCSVVTTLTATEAGDEIKTADLVVSDFNSDSTCSAIYTAKRVKDNPVVYIYAQKIDGVAERPDADDFNCTVSGTTVVTEGFDNIVSRQKLVKVVPDFNDPRVGATDVRGSVTTTPGGVSNVFLLSALNGSSVDMRVDGSSTPVNFRLECSNDHQHVVSEIRLFGGCSGLKFGQHLCKNTILTNGVVVSIQSGGQLLTLPAIQTTEDYKNKFSSAGLFSIDVQAGADQFLAIWSFAGTPFIIRECGAFGEGATDDYIQIKIQDNLTGSPGGNLAEFSSLILGFERVP